MPLGLRYPTHSPSWTQVKTQEPTLLLFWQGCSARVLRQLERLLQEHQYQLGRRHLVVGLGRPHLRRVTIVHDLC